MGILDITISTLALVLFLHQPRLATCSDIPGPILTPIVEGVVCSIASCGKGACKIIENGTLTFPGYECECDLGWNHAHGSPDFMPCVLPNCLESSCVEPGKGNQGHFSPNDYCTFANCGGGVCNNTSFPYSCECDEGYGNLLNNKLFPCVKNHCVAGPGCNQL